MLPARFRDVAHLEDVMTTPSAALVETLRGGGLERGARVTATGAAVLEAYREMEQAAAAAADGPAYARLRTHLRTTPVPAED